MTDLELAVELAEAYVAAAGGVRPGMCWPASWTIREALGWPIVEGERGEMPHAWNAMPDGRWFDATASIFGDDGPQVIAPDDSQYRPSRPAETGSAARPGSPK